MRQESENVVIMTSASLGVKPKLADVIMTTFNQSEVVNTANSRML